MCLGSKDQVAFSLNVLLFVGLTNKLIYTLSFTPFHIATHFLFCLLLFTFLIDFSSFQNHGAEL